MNEPSLMKVLERHHRLDELFLEHQTALLDRAVTRAAEALEVFAAAFLAHAEEEEREILPLYLARAPQPPGGQAGMFVDEHRKLRELLEQLRLSTGSLGVGPGAQAVLSLLDRETQFKNLLDHHDRRDGPSSILAWTRSPLRWSGRPCSSGSV